jgi:hypothetical protein
LLRAEYFWRDFGNVGVVLRGAIVPNGSHSELFPGKTPPVSIERYRRRESLVEEASVEMYLGDVSVRRVEDTTEALRSTRAKTQECDAWTS